MNLPFLRGQGGLGACRRPAENLLGKQFGLVTVIAPAPSLGSGARWRCRCECGSERVILAQQLKRHGVRSHASCGLEETKA